MIFEGLNTHWINFASADALNKKNILSPFFNAKAERAGGGKTRFVDSSTGGLNFL